MRYQARQYGNKWFVDDTHSGIINRRTIGVSLSEAEAKVIEFALNTVTDGDMLAKDWGDKDIFDPTTTEYYAGPIPS